MNTVSTFYTIIAHNKLETVKFETSVLDYDYAMIIFRGLINCVDVDNAYIIDGTTGEVLHEYR